MNPDPARLRQEQKQIEQAQLATEPQTQSPREFSSADEMIRFDAGQTTTPESISKRLKESVAREPRRFWSWWRRRFGRER
jgi:hypothetical protein